MLRIRYCNIWWCVPGGYFKYTVGRPISNTHKNMVNIIPPVVEVHEDGYKDLMEEGGIYGTSGVLWGRLCGV